MHAESSRRLRRTALLLAALLLLPAAACDEGEQDDVPRKKTHSQSPASIFDGSVLVGVKKGQPGFSTRSGYDYAGFEIALVNRLATYARFSGAENVDLPSLRRENILQNGGRDMIAATYSITEGRDKVIDFTAPYFKTYQGLLVRKDDDDIEKREDLKGKQVCTASGSTSDPDNANDEKARRAAKKALGSGVLPNTRLDYKECVKGLVDGNFDAVWTDEILLQGFAQAKKYSDDVKVVPKVQIGSQEYYGVGLRQGTTADCHRLNRALKKFMDDDWTSTFRDYFPELAKDGSFEQDYKPSASEFERLEAASCGARDK